MWRSVCHETHTESASRARRDPVRTPMQWNCGKHAGFSAVDPEQEWLPVGPGYLDVNVEEENQPGSILKLFKELTTLRRKRRALTLGHYRMVESGDGNVYAYERCFEDERVLVILNFGSEGCLLDLSHACAQADVLLSTDLDRERGAVKMQHLHLNPYEGLVVAIPPTVEVGSEIGTKLQKS